MQRKNNKEPKYWLMFRDYKDVQLIEDKIESYTIPKSLNITMINVLVLIKVIFKLTVLVAFIRCSTFYDLLDLWKLNKNIKF